MEDVQKHAKLLPIRADVAQFPTEKAVKGIKNPFFLATASAYGVERSIITWQKRSIRLGARRPEDTRKTCQNARVGCDRVSFLCSS